MKTFPLPSNPTPGRGIYLLPNLFTTAGLFAAFYAIIAALKGHYDSAAIAIFIAMIADAIDGRVARLTNTQSDFGREYDSLADMVSFGVAPALVIYSWGLHTLGKLGWLAAFLYTACGALRLARFNTRADSASKRYFQGLPIPSAAAAIASMVWLSGKEFLAYPFIVPLYAIVIVIVALLMVSNISYYSFKEIDFKGSMPFVGGILIVALFVAISLNPPLVLFVGFLLYVLSGPAIYLIRLKRHK